MISIVSFIVLISITGIGATINTTLYEIIGAASNITSNEIIKSHWKTFTNWQFPKDAFHEGGNEEILWANLYQIALSVVALCLAVYIDAKPTFIAAMFFFVIFGICHITAHATLHPWTYLPLHYSFVITGLLIGMTFGGIKSYKDVLCCLAVDFFLIQGLGQFFGVLSAFGIMCYGLRHHLALMFTMAILGCQFFTFKQRTSRCILTTARGEKLKKGQKAISGPRVCPGVAQPCQEYLPSTVWTLNTKATPAKQPGKYEKKSV